MHHRCDILEFDAINSFFRHISKNQSSPREFKFTNQFKSFSIHNEILILGN